MFSRKNKSAVLPSTNDQASSAAGSPQQLNGAEGVATSGLATQSGPKISPLGQTDTSSPKEGEQLGARTLVSDAASTALKDGDALKPRKQMLSDWKRRVRRSAFSLQNRWNLWAGSISITFIGLLVWAIFSEQTQPLKLRIRLHRMVFPHRALASTGSSFRSDCCLNNNIMFTVGRIVRGCELAGNEDVVVLPPDLDSGGAWRTNLALFNETAIQKLTQVALQYGCTLVSASVVKTANLPIIQYSDWKMVDNGPYTAWFYRSMQLHLPLTTIHNQCYPPIHSDYTAVHARIEKDWYPYCSMRSTRADGAKACYTPREIASAIQDLRPSPSTLVLLYGEPAKQFARGTGEHPLETDWHSASVLHGSTSGKLCATSIAKLSYCERAMVDLWVAIHARQFVGTLASTFSNGATIARTQRMKGQNWAYSCPAIAKLVPRLDGGELRTSTHRTSTDGEACRRNDASQNVLKVNVLEAAAPVD
jgi:hypothetical protein